MLSAFGPKQGGGTTTYGANKNANDTPNQSAQSKSLHKHPPPPHVVFELSTMVQPFSHLTNSSSYAPQRTNINQAAVVVNLVKDDPGASNSQETGSAQGSRRDFGNP